MKPRNIIDKNILDLQVKRPDFVVNLEESRKEKKFIDVQLQIGDKLFHAHRVILSAVSPYLKAALSDQWSTSKICPISAEFVDPEIMEDLLHFLYTGSIQLTPDNVHPFCVAAHFLQIPGLLEPSIKHLCRMITVENVLTLFEFSLNPQLESLRTSCLQFIHRSHKKVFKDPQILQFSSRMFNNLVSGLKELNLPRMALKENTFDCIVRWTEVNLSDRLGELPGLLKNIPLEDLPLKFLTETVSQYRLVKESISCSQAVSAVLGKTGPERGDNLVVLSRDGQKMSCYDSETKRWKNLPGFLQPRFSYAVTVVNRKDIVVCGGSSNCYSLDSAEMFEWASQTWKQLPAMPIRFSCGSMASLDGHLYIIGDGDNVLRTRVLCFSFETQQWQFVKPMNTFRRFPRLIAYDKYLYAFGGDTNIVERYDPRSDEWTNIDDMPKDLNHRFISEVTVHENKIYASSFSSNSCDKLERIEEFNPETNLWAPHFESSRVAALTSINGQLVIAKSWNDTKWIFKYSFADNKWIKFSSVGWDLTGCRMVTGAFY